MSEVIENFSKEIETLRRMINGYLSTDPVLSAYELDTLALTAKEKLEFLPGEIIEGVEKTELRAQNFKFRAPLCCMNPAGGDPYPYYGFSCPNGDVECG